jgi:hypothetical protein
MKNTTCLCFAGIACRQGVGPSHKLAKEFFVDLALNDDSAGIETDLALMKEGTERRGADNIFHIDVVDVALMAAFDEPNGEVELRPHRKFRAATRTPTRRPYPLAIVEIGSPVFFCQRLKLQFSQIFVPLVGEMELLCTQRDKRLDADCVKRSPVAGISPRFDIHSPCNGSRPVC